MKVKIFRFIESKNLYETLEESLEILREESKKRRVKADDLIIDIEEELKNQDESIAKCNELIQEIVDRLNQDNKMVCPMCQESCMIHEEYNGTHIYICEPCPFVGFELVETKDRENMIKWLEERK